MSSKLLSEVGAALYGPDWHAAMAADLAVPLLTIRDWTSGAVDVPAGAYMTLLRLAQDRAEALEALIVDLVFAAAPP